MEQSLHKFKFLAVLFLLLSLSSIESAHAQKTWDAGAGTTNWGDGANWAPNGVPTAGQTVTIANGLAINVNVAAVCSSLTISGGTNDTSVTITGTNSITTGAVSIGAGTGNGDDQILAVGAGSLNCTSIAITATGNANRISAVTISSGTVTCSGNITLNDANDDITFTGGGLLRVGGNMSGGTFTRSTGTVEYYGDGTGGTSANQSIAPYTYYNLVTSGSGTKSLTANTVINGGSVNVQNGTTLDLLAFTLNRSASGGTLTVAGSLWLGGTSGGQTGSNFPTNFSTLALTSGTVSYDTTTGGQTIFATPTYGILALDNTSGTQTAGGNITATTVNNNIGGTLNMGTNTLSLTNVTNAGIIRTQNTSANPIPAGKTWGGTVQFDGAGQSVPGSGTTFNNLIYAGSGTKTLTGGAMTISSDFTVNSGVVANLGTFTSSADRLYLGGNGQNSGSHGGTGSGATFINTTYFSATSGRINVATAACTAGTWLGGISTDWNNAANWCGSVPTASTNVIIPSGAAFQPSIGASGGVCNNITINSGATLTITSTNSLTVSGNWTNNGTFTANSSTVAFNGTTQSISGATTFSSLSVTNGTTAAGAALTVSGVLTVASGATLDMSTFALSGAALTTSGTGTLRTQASGATPLPTGRTWSQNVEYYGSSAQTILPGTYSGNLTLSGARGANALTFGAATNIGGNLTIAATSSATIGLNFNSAGNVRVFNIGGDYIQSSAINVEFGSSGSGITTTINLTGNFSKTAGYMTTSVADNAVFNFVGTNQNIQSNGGTQIKWMNFYVANGSTCTLNGAFNFEGSSGNPGLFTVNSGGTLVCGTNVLGGTPNTTFTLANGGNLEIGSSAGITTAGTATGNIQAVIRTFGTGANYIYNGGGAQAAGTGLPATVGSLAVINNTTLTLPSAKAITNNFSIASGSVANLGTFTHTAGTLTMGGFGSPNGTHGSTTSAATYKNNTFFAATTGIVNVGTGTCAAFTAAISGTAAICNGGSTNLSVAITGGLPNYTVVSSAGTVNNYTSGNPVSVSPGTTTNYTLTSVRDNNGCPATTSGTTTVTVNAVPAAGTLTPTPAAGTICSGGTVSATASAGTGGAGTIIDELEYSLNGGSFTAYTSGTAINTAGQTSVSIRTRRTATGSGCTASGYNTVSWTINAVPASGILTPTPAPGTICAGGTVSATATAGSGGAGTIADELQVSLSGGSYTAYTSGTAINTIGQTSVSIRTRRTATGSGCTSSAYNTVAWTINASPTASVISGSAAICLGSTSNIQVAVTGGASPYNVVYSGGTVGSYVSGTNIPVAPTSTTTYTLLSVTDANGCPGTGNSGSAVLTIDSTTSVNGGPWSNGSPGPGKSVIFDNTNVTLGADFDVCSLTLKNNSVVSIQSGTDVLLSGALTIEAGSTFTLNNNANLLQTIPAGTSYSNSGNAIVKRNSSALKRFDYTLWSSPVTGQGIYAFSKLTLGNRFYVYRSNTNVYNNADLGFNLTGLDGNGVNGTDSNNVQFAPAKGYMIRMPWNHPTAPAVWNGSYTGVPNNGNITFTMTNGGAGQRFNLVGNPYPSPIDMTQFVADNSGRITGTLYFWRETNLNTSNNAYCSWAGGTFTTNGEAQVFDPNGLIRTGQGFFVEASGAATTVDFRNGQRSTDNSNQFFKNNNITNDMAETNRFWLNLTNTGGAFSQMAAGYMANATNGIDIYDGRNINEGNVLLNSILDNEDYTIQGKSLPFSASDMIPLSYKVTTAGSYTIAIDHVDGLFSGGTQPIYIKDNLLNTEHNLQTGAYNFASDSGTFNDRFEIVYQPRLSIPVFTPNTVIVYSENNGFVVNSGNTVMDSIKVFDIRGRLLQEKKDINSNQTTITGGLANQVLLIQITSEDGAVVTKKVIK